MGSLLKVRSTKVYVHAETSIPPGTLTTFAVGMDLEPPASQLTLGLDSQISAHVDAERSGSRIEDEGTVAEGPMRAVCVVSAHTSFTRKGDGARGQQQVREM